MRKSVKYNIAMFEFPVFKGIYPLASGYLKTLAETDEDISDACEFSIYSVAVNDSNVVEKFQSAEADIYAFSCYVWNMGLVKRLISQLLRTKPDVHIMLGGPQVMHKPELYLQPTNANLVLCNGEGEYTFKSYIRELISNNTNLGNVRGISYYENEQIITTEPEKRIRDLDMLPSPYLSDCFDRDKFSWAVIETNRGCPFKCTYCYWGAATNAKVHKFDGDRVLDEITWLSKNKVFYIMIADANFGMLKRDIEIAEHIAYCKKKYGFPLSVQFNTSKNTPERAVAITKKFQAADLISTQPISLQTLSKKTLESVKRSNISEESYTSLQSVLNGSDLSSILEIIWPLPGETLESFKDGLGRLCEANAQSFVVYPLLLINNVEMDNQREEFGLKTIEDPDPNSEAQIVVRTNDVNSDEYLDGLRFCYYLNSLHTLRGLYFTARRLNLNGTISHKLLISQFSEYCSQVDGNTYVNYVENTIGSSEHYKFSSLGGAIHIVTHSNRSCFDELIIDFMKTLEQWNEEEIRFLVELDLLCRPYFYSNTPITIPAQHIEIITIEKIENNGCEVIIPSKYLDMVYADLGFRLKPIGNKFRIGYKTNQYPFMKVKSLNDNYLYCQERMHHMATIYPKWESLERSLAVGY